MHVVRCAVTPTAGGMYAAQDCAATMHMQMTGQAGQAHHDTRLLACARPLGGCHRRDFRPCEGLGRLPLRPPAIRRPCKHHTFTKRKVTRPLLHKHLPRRDDVRSLEQPHYASSMHARPPRMAAAHRPKYRGLPASAPSASTA